MADTTPNYVAGLQPRRPFAAPDMPVGTPPLDDRAGGGPSPEDPFSGMTAREPFRLNLEAGSQDDPYADRRRQLIGMSSQGNDDVLLPLDGIVNGNPLGLEAFDLGFYEDGTPAIVINGAPVPVRESQWMALMNQRMRSREEMNARMEFAVKQRKARDSVSKVLTSMELPSNLGALLQVQAEMDPDAAVNSLMRLYTEVQRNDGRDLAGDIAVSIKKNDIGPRRDGLTKPRGKMVESRPRFPGSTLMQDVEIDVPSVARERADSIRRTGAPDAPARAYAWETLESAFPDPMMWKSMGGRSYGAFDHIAMFEGDKLSPMSLYERIARLASDDGQVWPSTVPYVDPLQMAGTSLEPPQQRIDKVLRHLRQLDAWSHSVLRWDQSSDESLLLMAQQILGHVAMQENRGQQGGTSNQASAPSSTTPVRASAGNAR